MPVMDGYTATRTLREQERLRGLPIIAMTADAMAGDRERALAAGMNDHIVKPLKTAQMFATMARWIRPGWSSAEAVAARAAPAGAESLSVIDPATWRNNGMGDDALHRRLLERFAAEQHDFAVRAGAFLEARNQQQLQRIAHTLKSVAGTLGARAVERAARDLEDASRNGEPQARLQSLLDDVQRQLQVVLAALKTPGR